MKKMIYAPVLIPTMCRSEHFIRLMESLKKNNWAKYTDVYIGLDYPPSEKYENGYREICRYLENDFKEFASFNVIRHSKNVGSFANMKYLYEVVSEKYDRYIRSDDDAEFSPNFIEYMDKCLLEYEDDPNVVGVTGYSYPIEWKVSKDATVFKENFIFPMWGTGFWTNKHIKIRDYLVNGGLANDAEYILRNKYHKMMNTSQCEYVNLCLSYGFKDSLAARCTDVSMRMYTAVNDFYVITPVISKVRNWGFDGSGEFCKVGEKQNNIITSANYQYNKQEIDQSTSFEIVEDSLNANEQNLALINKFDVLPLKERLKVKIKKQLYLLLGKQRFFQLCQSLPKLK